MPHGPLAPSGTRAHTELWQLDRRGSLEALAAQSESGTPTLEGSATCRSGPARHDMTMRPSETNTQSTGASSAVRVPFYNLAPSHEGLKAAVLADVSDLIDSGAFTNGPQVAQFEQAFAEYCGSAN